jgi:hypothetical protein
MTNTEAAWVAGVIFAAFLADMILNSGTASLFLLFKFMNLVDFVMFWD